MIRTCGPTRASPDSAGGEGGIGPENPEPPDTYRCSSSTLRNIIVMVWGAWERWNTGRHVRSGCLLAGGLPSGWPEATSLQSAGRDSDAAHPTDRSSASMTNGPETRYRRPRRATAAGHGLRAGRQERGPEDDRRVAAGREGPHGPAERAGDRGRAPGRGAGPGRRRGRQVPRGRADAGGRRLRADQLGAARRDRPPVPGRRCCSCPRCCTGSARRPSRASAAATSAAATWTSTTAASPGSAHGGRGRDARSTSRPTASAARTCTWTRRRTPAPRT